MNMFGAKDPDVCLLGLPGCGGVVMVKGWLVWLSFSDGGK